MFIQKDRVHHKLPNNFKHLVYSLCSNGQSSLKERSMK